MFMDGFLNTHGVQRICKNTRKKSAINIQKYSMWIKCNIIFLSRNFLVIKLNYIYLNIW